MVLDEDGAWQLRSKEKKFCIIVGNNILKNNKKVVTRKVVKSKKPKNMPKTAAVFLPQKVDYAKLKNSPVTVLLLT